MILLVDKFYSIRHAGESDYRNEQQTSERDDDTAERLYA